MTNMNMTVRSETDIRAAFARAWMTKIEVSRSGNLQSRMDNGNIIRVCENDGTYKVILFNENEVILAEASVSGSMTSVPALSSMITAAANS